MADGFCRRFKAVRRLSISDSVADGPTTKRQRLAIRSAGLERYKCDECEQSFNSKRALMRHLRQNKRHIGATSKDRPFKCRNNGFNMTFVRSYDRQRHERNNHPHLNPHRPKEDEQAWLRSGKTKVESTASQSQKNSKALVVLSKAISTKNPRQTIESDFTPAPHGLPDDIQQPSDSAELDVIVIQHRRKNKWKAGKTPLMIPCGLCRKPFQHDDLKGLSKHIAEHMDGFREEYSCNVCRISFISESDLRAHEISAQKGDCGFTFEHRVPCTGHHPPSGSNGSEESDRFDFCYRLTNWEQSQVRAYRISVASLCVATAEMPGR